MGTCSSVPVGTTPRAPGCNANLLCDGTSASCPTMCTGNLTCGNNTFCSGGVCTGKRPNGQSCQTAIECVSGFCADGFCCNTACAGGGCDNCSVAGGSGAHGTCTIFSGGQPGNPVCAPYLCNGTLASCPSACTMDDQCIAADFCNNSSCDPWRPAGQTCARPEQCASNFCVDGVCCNTLCDGACDSCNSTGAIGTCTVSAAGQPGSPSCAPYLCTGTSAVCATTCTSNAGCVSPLTCKSGQCTTTVLTPNGQTCTTDAQCSSGHCADGLCCNTACAGACEACNSTGNEGTCTALSSGALGEPVCAPFTCNGTSGACPSTCTADPECAAGAFCVKGVCSTQPRGQLGFGCGCSAVDGPALWLLLGLAVLATRRAREAR